MDFNLPSNSWVSQLQKSDFAVLDLGFEMLGLGLDNRGRTTKNAYRRIYSLMFHSTFNLENWMLELQNTTKTLAV